ncbi:MAG: hypothetical protein QXU75_07635, partial [Candidatus Methanomethylicaceae archaeon]
DQGFVETCTFEVEQEYGNFDASFIRLGGYRYCVDGDITERLDHLVVCSPMEISGSEPAYSGLQTIILDQPYETFMEPIFTWSQDVDVRYYPHSLCRFLDRIYLLCTYYFRSSEQNFFGYAYTFDGLEQDGYRNVPNFQFSRTNDFYITDNQAHYAAIQSRGIFLADGEHVDWIILPFKAQAYKTRLSTSENGYDLSEASKLSFSQVSLQNELNGAYAGRVIMDGEDFSAGDPNTILRSELDIRVGIDDGQKQSLGKFLVFDIENTNGRPTHLAVCQKDIYRMEHTPTDGYFYYKNPFGYFVYPSDTIKNSINYEDLIFQYKNPESAPRLEIYSGGIACKFYSDADTPYLDRFAMAFAPDKVYNPTMLISVGTYQYQRGEYGWGFSLGGHVDETNPVRFVAIIITTIPSARYKIYEVVYNNYSYELTHLATIADNLPNATDKYLLIARGSLIEIYKGILVGTTKKFALALRFRYHRLGVYRRYHAGLANISDEYAWAATLGHFSVADGTYPLSVDDIFGIGANSIGCNLLERQLVYDIFDGEYTLGQVHEYIPNVIDYIGTNDLRLSHSIYGDLLITTSGINTMRYGFYEIEQLGDNDQHAYPMRIYSDGSMLGVWIGKTPFLLMTFCDIASSIGYLAKVSVSVRSNMENQIYRRNSAAPYVPADLSIDPGRSVLASLSYLLQDYNVYLASRPNGIMLTEIGSPQLIFEQPLYSLSTQWRGHIPSVLQVEGLEIARLEIKPYEGYGVVFMVTNGIFETVDGQIWKAMRLRDEISYNLAESYFATPITGQWLYPGTIFVYNNQNYFLHTTSLVINQSGVSFTAENHLTLSPQETYEENP